MTPETNVDLSFFEWAFKGLVTVGAGISGWFFKNLWNETQEAKKSSEENEKALDNFKLHVSEYYSKEINTQASLSRIHDRLDSIGDDIKTLIGRNSHGK